MVGVFEPSNAKVNSRFHGIQRLIAVDWPNLKKWADDNETKAAALAALRIVQRNERERGVWSGFRQHNIHKVEWG